MKKIILCFFVSFLIISCSKNIDNSNSDLIIDNNIELVKSNIEKNFTYELWKKQKKVLNSEDYYENDVLYLIKKNWDKIEIDESDWIIENVEFLDNLLIYEWGYTWWMIKKIYDVNLKKEVWRIPFWEFTSDKDFIYSCIEWWYGPWYISSFNLDTLVYKNYFENTDWKYIKKCNYNDYILKFEICDSDWKKCENSNIDIRN